MKTHRRCTEYSLSMYSYVKLFQIFWSTFHNSSKVLGCRSTFSVSKFQWCIYQDFVQAKAFLWVFNKPLYNLDSFSPHWLYPWDHCHVGIWIPNQWDFSGNGMMDWNLPVPVGSQYFRFYVNLWQSWLKCSHTVLYLSTSCFTVAVLHRLLSRSQLSAFEQTSNDYYQTHQTSTCLSSTPSFRFGHPTFISAAHFNPLFGCISSTKVYFEQVHNHWEHFMLMCILLFLKKR